MIYDYSTLAVFSLWKHTGSQFFRHFHAIIALYVCTRNTINHKYWKTMRKLGKREGEAYVVWLRQTTQNSFIHWKQGMNSLWTSLHPSFIKTWKQHFDSFTWTVWHHEEDVLRDALCKSIKPSVYGKSFIHYLSVHLLYGLETYCMCLPSCKCYALFLSCIDVFYMTEVFLITIEILLFKGVKKSKHWEDCPSEEL